MPKEFEWKTLGIVYTDANFSEEVRMGVAGWEIVDIEFNTNNSQWFFLLRRTVKE